MPSIYDLKPRFQRALQPMLATLAMAGITANQITVAAAVLSVGYGAAIAATAGAPILLLGLPVILLLRMALNAIDGMLAREFKQQSGLGLVLNELGDVVSDAALYLPLALVPSIDSALVVALVILALMSEFTGLLAVPLGRARNYAGPFGKSDRAVFFGAVAILAGFGAAGVWLDLALAAGVVLSLTTIVNRARLELAS
jgi:CDP-diacylglycerol--glycerol-3-phosphate 3-phosphatidyltransferase